MFQLSPIQQKPIRCVDIVQEILIIVSVCLFLPICFLVNFVCKHFHYINMFLSLRLSHNK